MKTIFLPETDSTNNYVKTHMAELSHLTFVTAERQTNGRGRLNRKWIDSGDDNLFLTIVIKPDKNVKKIYYPCFTQYLSVILAMTLEDNYEITPEIKWPNDVLIKGRKIAGILAEGTTKGTTFIGLALGIGVNLNTPPERLKEIDKPATSLFNETGKKIDKQIFFNQLSNKFCLLYDRYVCEGFKFIKDYYESKSGFLTKEISINVLGETHTGIAERITDDGALVLNENNTENIYYIGDIL